jgi:hypothetical protein
MNDYIDRFFNKVLDEAWPWIVDTYQTDGLIGLILTIVVGGFIFGGMGFLFYIAAKGTNDSMNKKS